MKKINDFTTTVFISIILLAIIGMLSFALNYEMNRFKDELQIAYDGLQTTQEALYVAENELSTTKEALQIEFQKEDRLSAELEKLNIELNSTNTIIQDLKNNEYEFVYLGEYTITHYCTENYYHICGTGTGLTATGTQVTAGRTVAVDPSVIPYGTELYIEGYGWRIAEDCGGAVNNNHIDVVVETHEEAVNLGVSSKGVWVLIKKKP